MLAHLAQSGAVGAIGPVVAHNAPTALDGGPVDCEVFHFGPVEDRGLSVRVTPDAGTTTRENNDKWGLASKLADKGTRLWKLELVNPAVDAAGGVVSWCCFVEQEIRIGGAAVLAGNVTGVGTWKKQRRNGYSSLLIKAVLALMTSRGLMVTLLLGVPNYYHLFGYVSIADPIPRFHLCPPATGRLQTK